jgi:uncharacterized protein (DUF1800 family)
MGSRISRRFWRILTSVVLVSLTSITAIAQDPDPNSPTPVLLSERDSTRALAGAAGSIRGVKDLTRAVAPAFQLGDTVDIFVTNLDLMEGEGANAFRVYALDKVGHQFRFPVIALAEVPDSDGVYRATLSLKDEIGFWDAPVGDGDVLIYLTWRGLASNVVKIGIGKIGGDIKEDPSARPTPFGTKFPRNANRQEEINAVGYRWRGDAHRFMQQAAFGPNLTLDNKLRRVGLRSWINEQFAMPYPSASNPFPNTPPNASTQPTLCDGGADDVPANCGRDTYTQYQPQTWFFKEAFYGDPQLKHRVTWALGQIWVTSGNTIQQGRHMVEWNKMLARHAFGNYRDLMKEMTLNATMGDYLDMAQSTRTAPNENYAREVAQLFSIGLFMLNQDGTVQRDAQLNPIPTYSQDEINALTRVLTGWSPCTTPASCPNLVSGIPNYLDPLLLNNGLTNAVQNRHDLGAKTLFSYPGSAATQTIAACPPTGTGACGLTCPSGAGNCTLQAGFTSAQALAAVRVYADASLDRAIDNLFNHPNVGPFIGKILIQHMVTSDPSPAYVSRVAAAFNNNGQGVRGDMKAVIRAILLDPEARGDVKTDPNFGKLREPVQLLTNFARTFNVRGANGTGQTDGNFAGGSPNGGRVCGRNQFVGLAQLPFLSPTVFNFYPPDYGVPGTTLIGPEFAILTTGTAVARASFINQMTFAPTNQTTPTAPATTPTTAYAAPIPVSMPDCPSGTSFDFADLVALSAADATGGQMVDELNRRMLGGNMSSTMRTSIMNALPSYTGTTTLTHESRVRQAIYLVASSSQYQVQR